jgi:hypothetical protein
MPKLVGLKERTHRPIEGCGGCDVIMGATKRSLISQRCPHCDKPFCLDCYSKHDQEMCKVRHRGSKRG